MYFHSVELEQFFIFYQSLTSQSNLNVILTGLTCRAFHCILNRSYRTVHHAQHDVLYINTINFCPVTPRLLPLHNMSSV